MNTQAIKQLAKGEMHLRQNVEMVLRDSHGNVKRLFQLNKLGHILMKLGAVRPHTPKLILQGLLLGSYRSSMNLPNLVTNAGLAVVSSRFNGSGGLSAVTYIAIGTGAVAPAATDTALGAEITTGGGARAASTVSRVTTTVANDTAQDVVTFTFTGAFAITESGLFNAVSGVTLVTRDTFASISVASGDSLQLTHKVAIA